MVPFVFESPILEVNDQMVDLIKQIKVSYPKLLFGLQLYNNAHHYTDNKGNTKVS